MKKSKKKTRNVGFEPGTSACRVERSTAEPKHRDAIKIPGGGMGGMTMFYARHTPGILAQR